MHFIGLLMKTTNMLEQLFNKLVSFEYRKRKVELLGINYEEAANSYSEERKQQLIQEITLLIQKQTLEEVMNLQYTAVNKHADYCISIADIKSLASSKGITLNQYENNSIQNKMGALRKMWNNEMEN